MKDLFDILKSVGYKVDAENKEAIEQVAQYLSGDQKKGLLFTGYFGTGKTWLMKILNDEYTPIRLVSTDRLNRETLANGDVPSKYLSKQINLHYDYVQEKVLTRDWPFCFDELGGQNDTKLNIWGTPIYPMAKVLKQHHEEGIKCHAITNFSLQDLQNLYGGETIDRFKTMFETVKFKGGSRR